MARPAEYSWGLPGKDYRIDNVPSHRTSVVVTEKILELDPDNLTLAELSGNATIDEVRTNSRGVQAERTRARFYGRLTPGIERYIRGDDHEADPDSLLARNQHFFRQDFRQHKPDEVPTISLRSTSALRRLLTILVNNGFSKPKK